MNRTFYAIMNKRTGFLLTENEKTLDLYEGTLPEEVPWMVPSLQKAILTFEGLSAWVSEKTHMVVRLDLKPAAEYWGENHD